LLVVGARIIGVCAHIASVIWYLSFGRYLPRLMLPADSLDDNIDDAAVDFYEMDTSLDDQLSD